MSPELIFLSELALKMALTAFIVVIVSVTVERSGPFVGALIAALPTAAGAAYIILAFDVDTDVAQDKLDQLLKLTERYCVVYQTLKNGPPVEVSLKRKS